jgi:hypothetical protein
LDALSREQGELLISQGAPARRSGVDREGIAHKRATPSIYILFSIMLNPYHADPAGEEMVKGYGTGRGIRHPLLSQLMEILSLSRL